VHLYIHVPFCARRCSYCDFAIAVRREVPSLAFAAAIQREWEQWQEHPAWAESGTLDTVYVGGGTPSRLEAHGIARLIERIRADRQLARGAEVTLEANPDDVDRTTAEAWVRAGINRVSLGSQSFQPAVLAWMHRTHDAEQIGRAVGVLRAAGLVDISLDLIYGLPEAVQRNWNEDLDRAFGLLPTHLSLYGLTIEPHTALGKWTARGESISTPDDRAADEYLLAHERLTGAGYQHYEVSNGSLPGRRARHNSAYWTRAPFIGLGPSAHSALLGGRSWNVREWEEYRRRTEEGRPLTEARETLTPAQVRLEELYLGLRTSDGLPVGRLPEGVVAQWRRQGWAEADPGRVRLTPEGWLRLDALVASVSDY